MSVLWQEPPGHLGRVWLGSTGLAGAASQAGSVRGVLRGTTEAGWKDLLQLPRVSSRETVQTGPEPAARDTGLRHTHTRSLCRRQAGVAHHGVQQGAGAWSWGLPQACAQPRSTRVPQGSPRGPALPGATAPPCAGARCGSLGLTSDPVLPQDTGLCQALPTKRPRSTAQQSVALRCHLTSGLCMKVP